MIHPGYASTKGPSGANGGVTDKEKALSVTITLPDGKSKTIEVGYKSTVGEVKRVLLKGTSFNYEEYSLKTGNIVLTDEALAFRRAETLIVKALLRGETPIVTLQPTARVLSREVSSPHLESKQANTVSTSRHRGQGQVMASAENVFQTRRTTFSAFEKQKSPRNPSADPLPPKRLITIGSRHASALNTTRTSEDSESGFAPQLSPSSPATPAARPDFLASPPRFTAKNLTVNRRLVFDEAGSPPEPPSRVAVVVFPIRLQLWNSQIVILNCSSAYTAAAFIDHAIAKVSRIVQVESIDDISKLELEVNGQVLASEDILSKNSYISECLANGRAIPTALIRIQNKLVSRPATKPSTTSHLSRLAEFQVLVLLPTGQTIVHKCKDNFTLLRLKKEVLAKARDRDIDLSPERYSFATWNEGVIPTLPVVLSAAVTNQLTIFKDEGVALDSLPFIRGSLKKCITPKFLLIPKRTHTFSPAELERQVAVKALIGRPLLVSDDNDEIATLRRTMAKIRAINRKVKRNNTNRSQARVSVRIVRQENTKTNTDLFVLLVLPLNEVKKTVHVKDTEIADEFLAKIFAKYYQKKVPHKKPTDFVLKAAGLAEFIDGAFPLHTFEYIRSKVAKNQRIELVVVERPQRQDEEASDPDSDAFMEDLSEDTAIRYVDTEVSVDSKPWDQMTCISLWDMDRTFRLRIVGVENLSPYYNNLKQLLSKTEAPNLEEGRISLYVSAGIYHGGSLLVPIVTSQLVAMSANPRWHQWFNFSIKMRNIPRAARVCFTLFARSKGESSRDVPIGWVNCQLFNFKHELRTGVIGLSMYRDDKANPIGTCVPNAISNAATLFVEFDAFKLPVVFPTETAESPEYQQEASKRASELPLNAEELNALISKDPLYPYTAAQRDMIWENRFYFMSHPKSLPKVLASVDLADRLAVQEMKRLIDVWVPLSAIDALELLDSRFTEPKIRERAVEWVDVLPDEELLDYLLQLVQVLKYEPYHDSALARFLVRRALWSSRIGHSFFWFLKSEMHVQEISERYGLLLEAYLFGSGRFLVEIKKQDELMVKMGTAANSIKQLKDAERREMLLEHLRKIDFPGKVSLPLNPSLEANGIIVESCKYMDSKKLPLWVVLHNADPNGSPIYIIFKSGDDLRQDMLTLQMIRIMDKLWKKEGLDLQMSPYGCISTGDGVGMIEVVLNADTTASISKRAGGATAAFYVDPLAKWLQKHNPTEEQYQKAVEVFIKSCAGYCVATYVLGIGDRHNDNIMVTKSGRLFHIDFGHFLGNYKKKFGIKRERAPFVLTPDFAFVMGGETSPNFKKFIDYCCTAYNILRQHANKFINLFAMMLSTGIPELTCVEDINYLRNAFVLDSTEEEAAAHFTKLIYESLSTKTTQLNNAIHILAH